MGYMYLHAVRTDRELVASYIGRRRVGTQHRKPKQHGQRRELELGQYPSAGYVQYTSLDIS